MVIKKKKSVLKKKKKKIKAPFVSKYAPVDYEALMAVPKIKFTMKLIKIKSENSHFDLFIPNNVTVSRIKELINEKHMGSCYNIKLYLDPSNPTKLLEDDLNIKLKDMGFKLEQDLFYEFDPIIHPLLEMGN
jgi:hypothetical protein